MKSKQANKYTIQCMWQGISERKKKHDLTFCCTRSMFRKYLGYIALGRGRFLMIEWQGNDPRMFA